MSLLEVEGLNSYYGDSHILFDVSLKVGRNEVVALLGRNGAGKSTTLKSLMGVVTPRAGKVTFDGKDVAGQKSHFITQAGMQLGHEDRRIFGSLNVEENLVLAGLSAPNRWPLDRIYEMFPRLKERQHTAAGVLSGGEQQMLTLCRTLMGDPELVMIDEPTEGLAPKIVELVAEYLKTLKSRGVSVLLVEQKLTIALEISERCYVMGHGAIVFEGTPAALRANAEIRKEWLEV